MKVAKMAAAPMLRNTGVRLPISAQVKPPITRTAIMIDTSPLMSPV